MKLHSIKAPKANKKHRKRVGRGQGSGIGEQSSRGHNGQKSRRGNHYMPPGFEGGQLPLKRRIPKFGFKNPFKVVYNEINLDVLADFVERGKLKEQITVDDLVQAGLADRKYPVKILGRGEPGKALKVEAHRFTGSAADKLEKAGGSATTIS